MSVLTVQELTGSKMTFVVPDGSGDYFENDGSVYFFVQNDRPTDVTATATAYRKCEQGFYDDEEETIESQSLTIMGPFEPYRFNDGNGRVKVTLSDTSRIGVAAIHSPKAIRFR